MKEEKNHLVWGGIFAVGQNGAFGKKTGKGLPFHIPEELKHFQEKTLRRVILMGRETFDAIGRPLPNRLNLVLSSTQPSSFLGENLLWVRSFKEATEASISYFKKHPNHPKEILCIGGKILLESCFSSLSFLWHTEVQGEFEADCYLEENLSPWSQDWKLTFEERKTSQNGLVYIIRRFERVNFDKNATI